jgi:hypothetical protein
MLADLRVGAIDAPYPGASPFVAELTITAAQSDGGEFGDERIAIRESLI